MSNDKQIMQKTKDENSFFIRCHQSSILSDEIFCNNPKYNNAAIKILQVMILDEQYLLIECVYI